MVDDRVPTPVLVVGCGSVLRGDDAVGPLLVRRLAERGVPDGVEVLDAGTAALDAVLAMRGRRTVVVVDAACTGAPPGTVHRLPADRLVADRPDADRPDADRPDADRPDADRPDADRPDADRPDVDRPDVDRLAGRGTGMGAGAGAFDPHRLRWHDVLATGHALLGDDHPARVVAVLVEVGSTEPGAGLTAAVAAGLDRALVTVLEEVAR